MLKSTQVVGLCLAALTVYIAGLFITIMDVDSAQYASISKDMAQSGSYLQVKHFGEDYLDKPPLMFWVNALFFTLFGYSNWVFKLGSFLFTILGVFSTFKIGTLLYNSRVGKLSALLLLCTQAIFLINNDVRTDTMLIGGVAFSIWQLLAYVNSKKWTFLFGASLGIALAMMAKGPIGIMVPVIALGSYLIGKGRWKDLFRWQYLVLAALVLTLLGPMLYGLYMQYDAQPEKEITFISEQGNRVETGVSGVKFFFWTQSFGRITGENVWRNNTGPFFFVHSFLWSFLPWTLLFLEALFSRITAIVRLSLKGEKLPELLTPLGFIVPFLVLSASSYKLPHYIFVLYPLASILLANRLIYLVECKSKRAFNWVLVSQVFIAILSVTAIGFITFYIFASFSLFYLFLLLVLLSIGVWFFIKHKRNVLRVVLASAFISVAVNWAMNAHFYPQLLTYQAGNQIAEYIQESTIKEEHLYRYNYFSFSLVYYLDYYVEASSDKGITKSLRSNKPVYILCSERGFEDLQQHFNLSLIKQFNTFKVTLLSFTFLNPKTRAKDLEPVFLVEINSSKI